MCIGEFYASKIYKLIIHPSHKLHNEDGPHSEIITTPEHTGSMEIKLKISFNLISDESACPTSYFGKALSGVMKDIINCLIR
jgi:hypothetical protein